MSVSEQELEVLENFLDGDLPPEQESALLTRLTSEPALRAAADALRGERALRSRVWQSLEGTDAEVQRVMEFVEEAVDQHTAWSYRLSTLRKFSAAAACILVGFLVGYGSRGPSAASAPVGPSIARAPGLTVNPNIRQVELPITNARGEQVGVQRFNSPEEANRFIEDLNQWHNKQEQIKNSPNLIYTSEKF
jgi:hypothetical protein